MWIYSRFEHKDIKDITLDAVIIIIIIIFIFKWSSSLFFLIVLLFFIKLHKYNNSNDTILLYK